MSLVKILAKKKWCLTCSHFFQEHPVERAERAVNLPMNECRSHKYACCVFLLCLLFCLV
jgi:hypothetical protein